MSARCAMREEHIRMAIRASARQTDRRGLHSRIQKLPAISLNQVKMYRGPDRRMPRRTLRKKQHRILRAHWIGIENLAKKIPPISELRFKFSDHFFSDRIAALPHARSNRCNQVLRLRTELQPHPPHAQFHNPFHRSPPSRMESPNNAAPLVRHQYRNAVRRLDRNQQSRLRSDRTIRLPRPLAPSICAAHNNHQVRVKLPQRDNRRIGFPGNRFREQPAILHNGFSLIGGSKSQI